MYSSAKEVKHIACSRCRERKVRCDGEKPSCRRCERHGQSCEYIRGKKQQVKNEWVQHLRTFSAQPVGKPKSTPVPRAPTGQTSPSSVSSVSRRSHPPYYFTNERSSQGTRSPSPCFPSGTASVPMATSDVSPSTISYGTTSMVDSWNMALALTPPLTEDDLLDPTLYGYPTFDTYCANDFQPDFRSTGHIDFSGSRSSTPFSQASEIASVEGYANVPLSSSSFIPQNFISADINANTSAISQTWHTSDQYLQQPVYYHGTGYVSDF